ncbi:MAG: hypothetical protein Terrestrivirus5_170 [Terrestrivirus sp.]|uniref:Uncharacterized protein n=1 Tax=Terrestrivirus sp. TaxID=2487775 RepID=A0A3G4ZNB4_9VIRU|nr:MAG: hypothetical protein Terrestrivirus5_170 [Terrestrivirus sp.]
MSYHKTIIILDWDDTLFPTHWLVENKINLNDPKVRSKYKYSFNRLDGIMSKFLIKCMQYGTVIVITNALPVWVNIALDVLPFTSKLFKYIRVVSARKMFQNQSENMMDWKLKAFKYEISNKINKKKKLFNIISIGDAEYEYRALIGLHTWNKNQKKILKSIKLIKDPSINDLYDELTVLYDAIGHVCKHRGFIDWNFQKIPEGEQNNQELQVLQELEIQQKQQHEQKKYDFEGYQENAQQEYQEYNPYQDDD